jgi:hypothetical protein
VQKAIIIDAIEMNREVSPTINFKGRDLRKSFSAYREVRMNKNINIAVEEEKSATPSAMVKYRNAFSLKKFGIPVLSSVPPGMLNAAENTTVAIIVATSKHEVAVSFIHFSP